GVERARCHFGDARALHAAQPRLALELAPALLVAAAVDADAPGPACVVEAAHLVVGPALAAGAEVTLVARARERAVAAEVSAGAIVGEAHAVSADVLVSSTVGIRHASSGRLER